jgi:ribosomal protein S18 acetylase RimI-like enzyme
MVKIPIESDEWLTRIMNTNCYVYKCNSIFEYLELKKTINYTEPYFCTIKVKKNSEICVENDTRSVLKICKMKTYSWNSFATIPKQLNQNISFYEFPDRQEILKIAKDSFLQDRFHSDPRISKGLADKIKSRWISDNLSRKRNSMTLVYRNPKNSKVSAFSSLLINNDSLVIDLIAVSSNFRKNGIGSELVKASQLMASLRNLPLIVGTQEENHANELYRNNNFNLIHEIFVYHDTNQVFK